MRGLNGKVVVVTGGGGGIGSATCWRFAKAGRRSSFSTSPKGPQKRRLSQ
jgi:NAD(P)-dependent dehydrogenase (short-subunit alcohol dehydrogenase family)